MPVSRKLAIRLALHGCTNRPFYHIVVIRKHKARNAREIEQLGTYDPMPNANNEKMVGINFERMRYWLGRNVKPTKPVAQLLGLCGFFPIHPMTYIEALRIRTAAEAKQSEENTGEPETQEASQS